MEELSLHSLLTTKSRQRRSQSELPHASSASSSSSPASSLLMKEFVSQPMHTHILMASEEILCEKHISFAEDSAQESSACMSGPLERDDDAEHASPLENTRPPQETPSHSYTLLESAHRDVFLLQKDEELQKASSCARSLDVEDMPELECADSLETSSRISIALDGVDDTEQVVMINTQPQEMVMLDHTRLQATLAQILTPVSGVDDTKQAVMRKGETQEMSPHASISSERDVYTQHMPQQHNSEEMHAHASSPSRAEDNGEQAIHTQQRKGRVSQDMSARISTSVEGTKGTEYAADDTEHVSQMSNTGIQDVSAGVYSSSQRASGGGAALSQRNVESQEETLTGVSMIESSLRHHMQQGDAAKDEAAMRSFIMHRFLPAAKEVAAEHENSIASHVSKKRIEAPLPSLPPQAQKISSAPRTKHSEALLSPSLSRRSQRTPVTRHTKSRAQQPPPRGFASSRPAHSWHHQDVMPFSMRSCGYFCLGLKTALFRTHRTVSASARSTLRKKSWAPHPSSHTKVADASIACETEGQAVQEEAMGGVTKLQSATTIYVPVLPRERSPKGVYAQESPQRQVKKQDLSSRACLSSDGCGNAGCNSSLSQSDKVELAGNQFDNQRSMQSPHVEPVTVGNFARAALKEQDCEVFEEEGMASWNPKRTCDCKNPCNCHCDGTPLSHKLAGEPDACSSTLQDVLGGSEANGGKSACDNASKNAWQVDDEEDDEPQFFDALSRLNSLKSNASFYTIGSPRSEYETFGREGARINHEGGRGFMDASSQFETPRASVSENPSARSDCATTEKGTSGKVSSLSQRVGKGLKLETEVKQALSPSSKLDFSAYELEPEQGERRTGSSSSFRLSSWETMKDLYPSKAATVSPVFPAKCQNNTPNALGWPFGITTYRPVGGSPKERITEKHVACGNVPSPPLPPSPRESWLGKAVSKKASSPSTLATLQQKQSEASARKKLDFVAAKPDAERRWEKKVKESRVQAGHLRFSQELHYQHHPSNRKAIRPLKL